MCTPQHHSHHIWSGQWVCKSECGGMPPPRKSLEFRGCAIVSETIFGPKQNFSKPDNRVPHAWISRLVARHVTCQHALCLCGPFMGIRWGIALTGDAMQPMSEEGKKVVRLKLNMTSGYGPAPKNQATPTILWLEKWWPCQGTQHVFQCWNNGKRLPCLSTRVSCFWWRTAMPKGAS